MIEEEGNTEEEVALIEPREVVSIELKEGALKEQKEEVSTEVEESTEEGENIEEEESTEEEVSTEVEGNTEEEETTKVREVEEEDSKEMRMEETTTESNIQRTKKTQILIIAIKKRNLNKI